MKRSKLFNIIGRVFAVALSFAIIGMSTIKVAATGQTDVLTDTSETVILTEPLIVVDYYEITNEKIVPGEDFTLKMVLKNYSTVASATGVLIDISNPMGVAPVYGSVSQMFIGDIGAGESKEVVIDYNSWTTIVSDTLDFNVTIVSDTKQNYVVLRVPVGADSPFSILNASAPSSVEVYGLATLSLTFKVLGEERVKDVVLTAHENGQLIGTSQIGIISPGLTKTQQLLLSFIEKGEHTVDLSLEYVDETGQKKTTPVTSTIITVVDEVINPGVEPIPGVTPDDNMDSVLLMGIGGMLILIVFLVVVIVLRKNK